MFKRKPQERKYEATYQELEQYKNLVSEIEEKVKERHDDFITASALEEILQKYKESK
jgi:hypothetical protein